MSKKIVIMPTFGESHLIKYQIPNLIDTINPDIILYNEILFPSGPESNLQITKEFKEKYCYKNTTLAFDTLETQQIIKEANKKYKDKIILWNELKLPPNVDASTSYTLAVSNFNDFNIEVNEGDYIFPLEPDVFHHENSKAEINNYLNQLDYDSGFRSIWIDFIGNQYYTEKCHISPGGSYTELHGRNKSRKICIKFGTIDYYKSVVGNFQIQTYDNLYPTDLITYHYNWWKYDKFLSLRYDIIPRNKGYWEHWDKAMKEMNVIKGERDVVLRNNRHTSDIGAYAGAIHIDHPKHIKDHPNYLK